MSCKFKIGSKCFSPIHGWGKVLDYIANDYFRVELPHKANEVVMFSGKRIPEDFSSSWFTEEEAVQKFPDFPPPKRKVLKEMVKWAVVNAYGDVTNICSSAGAANLYAPGNNLLYIVKLTGTLEMEV